MQRANTHLKLLHFKPEKLNKFNIQIPDLCYRCREDKGTVLLSMIMFWREVRDMLQEILSVKLKLEPKFFIEGLYVDAIYINCHDQILINLGILQACKKNDRYVIERNG